MLDLFPGDRLWNRYRVEGVAANGAWLTRLHEPTEADKSPRNFLLLALERQAGLTPLAELLSLAGTAIQLKTSHGQEEQAAAPPRPSPQPMGRRQGLPGAGGHASAFRGLPLLGHVAWVGDPARGGMALVEVPPSTALPELLAATGALAPAAVLPLLAGLAAAGEAFLQAVQVYPSDSPSGQSLLRSLARLLNPGAVVLFADEARLGIRLSLPEPLGPLAPPRWAEFLAPEFYRGESASQSACVFSVARLGAFLMGAVEPCPTLPETAWAALAEWASGKRDPVREFLGHSGAPGIPPELRALLVSCLARTPASRLDALGKLHVALQALAGSPWIAAAARCQGCGFVLPADPAGAACPCCGRPSLVTPHSSLVTPGPSLVTSHSSLATQGMALVAAGVFLSGEQKTPRMLRAFAIDTLPVTEGDYKRFLSGLRRPPRSGGPGSRGPEYDTHPVTRLTWYEANEYAESCGKRLPTVHEWEKAARGVDGRKFPVGNNYRANAPPPRAGGKKGRPAPGTRPVGNCPTGASPYGVLDMAGNVLEWTSTARRAGQRLFRAVKGSCYLDGSPELSRCASVQYLAPESTEPYVGFRCVKDVE